MINFIRNIFRKKALKIRAISNTLAIYQGEHGWHNDNWSERL